MMRLGAVLATFHLPPFKLLAFLSGSVLLIPSLTHPFMQLFTHGNRNVADQLLV